MFNNLFGKTFYGNTIATWLIAIGVIMLAVIVAKIVYWGFGKTLKKITRKTKTKLDDIIVDKIEEPIVFAMVIAGIWYGLSLLNKSDNVAGFVQKAYYVLIIINSAWMLSRLLDALIEEYLVPVVDKSDSSLDDQLLPIVRKAFRGTIWIIALILALNNAGYDVGALLAGLGIGGLAFALAAKDTVANLFGGFTIFMDKPFGIGDRIKVAGFDGAVEEIGIRSIRLRTLAGRRVTIPNADVANDPIENVTSEPTRKVAVNLGLTYKMDNSKIQLAIDLLKKIAASNDSLLNKELSPEDINEGKSSEKKIVTIFEGFGDFSLNILFIYYIKGGEDNFEVMHQVNFDILREFNENKLDFAFPTQTIITTK